MFQHICGGLGFRRTERRWTWPICSTDADPFIQSHKSAGDVWFRHVDTNSASQLFGLLAGPAHIELVFVRTSLRLTSPESADSQTILESLRKVHFSSRPTFVSMLASPLFSNGGNSKKFGTCFVLEWGSVFSVRQATSTWLQSMFKNCWNRSERRGRGNSCWETTWALWRTPAKHYH